MTETDQKAGTRLWVCSNANGKSNYISGMRSLLDGARHYLFGSINGCLQSTQTVAGAACPTTVLGPDPRHFPYTLVVPAYTSLDVGYAAAVSAAVDNYRNALATAGKRPRRTSELARQNDA